MLEDKFKKRSQIQYQSRYREEKRGENEEKLIW